MDQTNQFSPANNLPSNTPPSSQIPSVFPDEKKTKKIGPIIAVLVALLIIVIVSLYLLAANSKDKVNSVENCIGVDCISTDYDQPISGDFIPTDVTPRDIAPITNTADDIDSLQADLDEAIQGLDSQNI